ncbi:MAG: 3'(2'),5'-bisphosphate nucleotidase CysQ [Alphaproteobacteria bacterium]|nr:3'(2'),5'-bisphosphate nucleotidase CysQ [Alphaproteobacteria bacterium]
MKTDAEISRLLQPVRALALEAGAEIMKYYKGEMGVRRKDDASPVTDADEAAEAIILPALRELTPGIPVVAEEAMSAGAAVDVSGGRFWLVDPLDGTKEFIAHRDEFTVNIALVVDGAPVLGVVHAPALALTYAAAGPGTATVERSGAAPAPIAARAVPAGGLVAVGSRSHGDREKMQALFSHLTIAEVKVAGSSIKFCLVASGEADIYPRYGHTREWDTAAGHAVLRAAGGSVRTLDGAEMGYGKPHFLNDEFIARGRDDPAENAGT